MLVLKHRSVTPQRAQAREIHTYIHTCIKTCSAPFTIKTRPTVHFSVNTGYNNMNIKNCAN